VYRINRGMHIVNRKQLFSLVQGSVTRQHSFQVRAGDSEGLGEEIASVRGC